jgi:hypothetical protein
MKREVLQHKPRGLRQRGAAWVVSELRPFYSSYQFD